MSARAPAGDSRFSRQDVALLAALALVWGSAYVFIREGIVFGAAALPFAAIRYALSAVAFFLLAAGRREAFPPRRALLVSAAVGGTLLIGVYGGFLYWGEQYTTGGYASVLASTAPILTLLFAWVLLPSERLGPLALGGIAIGFAGVVVLVVPELSGSSVGTWPGPAFVIGAFVAAAIGSVLLRRFGGGRQGLWQIGTQFAVGALLIGTAALVLPYPRAVPLSVGVLGSLLSLVVFSSVLGYFVYFLLLHRAGPVGANLVAYLVPIVGVGIGSGFFAEPISVWEIVGSLIVITGVSLVIWAPTRGAVRTSSAR
ncbi:MAG TPA: EamA family transporter [Thermoplasmata archaeon]|nr:EamA family transporter [Thermoplasmata archaeon]